MKGILKQLLRLDVVAVTIVITAGLFIFIFFPAGQSPLQRELFSKVPTRSVTYEEEGLKHNLWAEPDDEEFKGSVLVTDRVTNAGLRFEFVVGGEGFLVTHRVYKQEQPNKLEVFSPTGDEQETSVAQDTAVRGIQYHGTFVHVPMSSDRWHRTQAEVRDLLDRLNSKAE